MNLLFDNLIYRFWHGDTDRSREYYYLFDGLGSVIALTDADGDTVETYRYDVYGKSQILDNTRTVITVSAVGNNYPYRALWALFDCMDTRLKHAGVAKERFA